MHARTIAASILACLALGACGGEPARPTMSVSVGQQLIDLKKAKDSGALSAREYEQQKAQLIRNVE